MKTAVIFTGGTIGSTLTGSVISTDTSTQSFLLRKVSERTGREWEFAVYSPYTVLSENMTGKEINLLADCILQAFNGGCKGVIVTHGTDTLQYTACLLSYIFGSSVPPVVLVSANYPLGDMRSNGEDNCIAALDFIENGYGKGVFVAYKNDGEKVKIHRASRLLPCVAYSDRLESAENSFYGEYTDGKFVKNSAYAALPDEIAPANKVKLGESADGILWIKPYTGLCYPPVAAGVKAVLHDAFHSGTVRTDGKGVTKFAAALKQKNIPLYLSGGYGAGAQYASTKRYGELNIKILPKASPVAMYCKLWLAQAGGFSEEFLFSSLGEDILPDAEYGVKEF